MQPIKEYYNPASGLAFRLFNVAGRTVKVIDAPGVYLVGSMRLHDEAINAFLADHGIDKFKPWGEEIDPEHFTDPNRAGPIPQDAGRNGRGTDQELAVELAGRLCYNSYNRPRPGGVEAFVTRLKGEGHGSVFEHPHYSFIVTGVSRNMTLELNRHRPLNISGLSSRFVDAAEVGFVSDPKHTPAEFADWLSGCVAALGTYERLYASKYARAFGKWKAKNFPHATDDEARAHVTPQLDRKFIKKARDSARDVLPGGLETRVFYTVNARAARFIFEKRCHEDAAYEIRRAMNLVYVRLKTNDPRLFDDLQEVREEDGTFTLKTAFPKI